MDNKCLVCTPYFQCAEHLAERPFRKIIGVKISYDFGKTWKTKALCEECLKNLEPPTMCRRGIEAGVFTCDFCDAINKMYRAKIKRKAVRMAKI